MHLQNETLKNKFGTWEYSVWFTLCLNQPAQPVVQLLGGHFPEPPQGGAEAVEVLVAGLLLLRGEEAGEEGADAGHV